MDLCAKAYASVQKRECVFGETTTGLLISAKLLQSDKIVLMQANDFKKAYLDDLSYHRYSDNKNHFLIPPLLLSFNRYSNYSHS